MLVFRVDSLVLVPFVPNQNKQTEENNTDNRNNRVEARRERPSRDTNLDPSRLDQCLQYVHFTFTLSLQTWNELNDDDVSFLSRALPSATSAHKVSILFVDLTKWSIIYETVSFLSMY